MGVSFHASSATSDTPHRTAGVAGGAGPADSVAPFYLRFVVSDRPGILAGIAAVLARHGINVDAVFQAPWTDKGALPFVVTVEPVDEERLGRALGELAALPFHVEPPYALPMTP